MDNLCEEVRFMISNRNDNCSLNRLFKLQGIDEDAPQFWKQMLAATDALEFYESQSIENRRIIQIA